MPSSQSKTRPSLQSEGHRLKINVNPASLIEQIHTEIATKPSRRAVVLLQENCSGRKRNLMMPDLPFYILPDDKPPFNQLPPGKRGILGLQVVVALRHFAWEPTANTFHKFSGPTGEAMSRANLAFDASSMFTQLSFRGSQLDMSDSSSRRDGWLLIFETDRLLRIQSEQWSSDHHAADRAVKREYGAPTFFAITAPGADPSQVSK